MQLINDDSSGWSITEFLPMQSRDGIFTVRGIPPGDYHLYHHLFNALRTYRGPDGKDNTVNSPAEAWGGVPVTTGRRQDDAHRVS